METIEEKLEFTKESHALHYALKVPFDESVGFDSIDCTLMLSFNNGDGHCHTEVSAITVHSYNVIHFLCRNNRLTFCDDKTIVAVCEVLQDKFGNENDTRWEIMDNHFTLWLFPDDLERLSGKCFKNYFDKDMAEAVANNGLRYVKQLLDTADSAVRKWASKNEWAKEKTNEVVQD